MKGNNQICLTIGKIVPSSPSTKEFHALSFPAKALAQTKHLMMKGAKFVEI